MIDLPIDEHPLTHKPAAGSSKAGLLETVAAAGSSKAGLLETVAGAAPTRILFSLRRSVRC
ncbi:hypothetical protein SBA3_1730006 [Candidatus Sulfopaludibacter sp. SbA3]|nr:hypothetical protein SBA3_1730006 [Candidatus Sulfopaludibacter sp. SbA3]